VAIEKLRLTIAFFGDNHRRFYRSEPILVTATPPANFVFSYTPTAEEWQAIVTASRATSGSPATIHWSLIGRVALTDEC
jgi:hypothetical protein